MSQKNLDASGENLNHVASFNHDQYERIRSPFNTPKQNCFVAKATRETVLLCMNAAALIETFMDAVCHIISLILD